MPGLELAASVALDGSGYGITGNFESEMSQGRIHGLACAFYVRVDNLDLGWWTNCSGLKMSWKFQNFVEGGVASSAASFPLHVEWEKVTLKRGLTRLGWTQVQTWLKEVVSDPTKSYTATISLYDAWASMVASWDLESVFPASWQGPDFDADSKKVAYETLTLNHNGFLGIGGGS